MIKEIANFRKKYPDYNDLDDLTLAEKLAAKYPEYSDLPGRVLKGMKEVTDPVLLAQLEGTEAEWDKIPNEPKIKTGWDAIPDQVGKEVTDPSILAQLEGESQEPKGFVGKTISNIPKSAVEYGKAIVTPFIHPIQTVSGLGNMMKGIDVKLRRLEGQKITPKEEEFEPYAEAAGQFIKERFGGWENIKKTISEDPVGFMGDLSTFLTGGGALASKIGPVAKAGQVVSKVGRGIEPVSIAGRGVAMVGKPAKTAAAGALGISTGAGKTPVEAAMKGGKVFRAALKGEITGEEVVGAARGGLHAIANERGDLYRQRLSAIENMPGPPVMDLAPVETKFQDLLNQYRIGVKKGGDLDFAQSYLRGDPKAQTDFTRIKEVIDEWSTAPGQRTPMDFDTLKRQLDNFYSESSLSRGAVSRLRSEVKNQLVSKVPEYETMVKDYEQTTKLIQETEKALSLKDKASIDTALRKLNGALREDDEFRRGLIGEVEKASGQDISAMISGRLMSGWMPRSWMGREYGLGTIGAAIFGRPELIGGLVLASPRLVGEFFSLLAKGKGVAPKISAPVRQGAFQVGRGARIQMEE